MFRVINVKGDVFRIIHRKMDSWWGCVPFYILEGGGGGMFCIILDIYT